MDKTQTRRNIRISILKGYASSLKTEETVHFYSGETLITMRCLKPGIFTVCYSNRDPTGPKETHFWNSMCNEWSLVDQK